MSVKDHWRTHGAGSGGGGAAGLHLPPKQNLKDTDFVDTMISKVLSNFSLQPTSATEIGWWLVHSTAEKYNKRKDVV
jgi:hypothetical protein